MAPTPKPVIAKLPIYKGATVAYTVTAYADGSFYCTCPAWKFGTVPAEDRRCKHCPTTVTVEP
jgi:hypothetical protein